MRLGGIDKGIGIQEIMSMGIAGKAVVVMATFNGARYVIEQLESILNQSFPPAAVYIADDGSTDGTVEIIQAWIDEHNLKDRWQLNVNSKNLGYAENFMQLIAKAVRERADYIFLADQDDIWLPYKAEQMLSFMKRFPAMGLLCSDLDIFYTNPKASHYRPAKLKWGNKPFLRFGAQWIWSQRPGCNFLLASGFAREATGLWGQRSKDTTWIAHDTFLWALAHLNNCIAYYPYVTMRYRRHDNNSSGSMSLPEKDQRIRFLIQLVERMAFFMSSAKPIESFCLDRQKNFYQRRISYLSRGIGSLPVLFADGLLHMKYYVRKRHFLSDLYVCIKLPKGQLKAL